MPPTLRLAVILPALLAGCAPGHGTVRVARYAGWSGWFQVSSTAGLEYDQRFERVPLGLSAPACSEVSRRAERDEGPVLVLVHGIKGDGPEWHDTVEALTGAAPSSMWMYRWVSYDERDAIVEGLGVGVTRLLQCLPESAQPLVVIAHSAGGIVASEGASRVAIPATRPEARVAVLTVASPLAGTVDRERNADGSPEARFMLDLGTRIEVYPPPALGVSVAHLRTAAPADPIMEPGRTGRVPNDPSVGVPGAPQVELPEGLGHDEALLWVAEVIAGGRWQQWLPGD